MEGAEGVVIGGGCLGKPWLFRDLKCVFDGKPPPGRPPVEEVVAVVREHFRLLKEHFSEAERLALLRMRKFGAWYAHGFPGAVEFRRKFQRLESEFAEEAIAPAVASLIAELRLAR